MNWLAGGAHKKAVVVYTKKLALPQAGSIA